MAGDQVKYVWKPCRIVFKWDSAALYLPLDEGTYICVVRNLINDDEQVVQQAELLQKIHHDKY